MQHYPEFSWEPLDVTTEDGYELTLFHVWLADDDDVDKELIEEGDLKEKKKPILWQHGSGHDAASWL